MLLLTATTSSLAETVLLAECPKEPEVVGKFVNNGHYCVREMVIKQRDIIDAECPSDYEYRSGYCRQRHAKNVKPTCPSDYQRYGKKCHSYCPAEYRQKYSECVLARQTLTPRYMKCAEGYHRYDAYCCVPGEDCPQLTCNVGSNVPGKFFYNDGICERQAESLVRTTTSRKQNMTCPEELEQVWGVCQEPCPQGYRPSKGKCDLAPCIFDPMTDKFVECPEATYKVSQAIF